MDSHILYKQVLLNLEKIHRSLKLHSSSNCQQAMHMLYSINYIIYILLSWIVVHRAIDMLMSKWYYSKHNWSCKQYKKQIVVHNIENIRSSMIDKYLDLKQCKFHLDRLKYMSYCIDMLYQPQKEYMMCNLCLNRCKYCTLDHSCYKLSHQHKFHQHNPNNKLN